MTLKGLLKLIPSTEIIKVVYSADTEKDVFKGAAKLCKNEQLLSSKVFTLFSAENYIDGYHYTFIIVIKEV